MIWIKKQRLKIVLTLVITLIGLLSPFLECFGVFYAEEFPSEIGLAGGYFVKVQRSSGSQWVVLIPENYINSFTVQGDGSLINLTSNTVNCRMISVSSPSTVYSARFQSLSGLEYYNTGNYNWIAYDNYNILDMNIYPNTDNPNYANQNLHLSYDTRHLVIVLFFATLLLILFRSVKRD